MEDRGERLEVKVSAKSQKAFNVSVRNLSIFQ